MFIGRKAELKKLEELYYSESFEFSVIYGRRRVGKSTLIRKFCEHKNYIYYVATQGSKKDNLHGLSKAIFQLIMPTMQIPSFASYEDLFGFLNTVLTKRLILAIDEYPYLVEGDASLSSIIQKYIDLNWKDSKLMLILCGSSMSFMENQVLGYKSPLYGRRTAQFKIHPFMFSELKELQWNYSATDMAILYAITGGIAEYLSFINPNLSVKENIIRMYLDPSGRMYEEPINLLKQELRNPNMYNSILNSIACGNATLNDIATKAGELPTSASFHLRSLIELGIVKKETAIGTKESSKKTLYRIVDSSFSFWYKFVYSNESLIMLNDGAYLYENIVEPELAVYMGKVFEYICQNYMLQPAVLKQAPFFYKTVGTWWGSDPKTKTQEEIDVCAMDKKHVLLGECKWTKNPIDKKVADDLVKQGDLFSQNDKYFYLFSKSGFSDGVKVVAQEKHNMFLITIDDIYYV